MESVVQKPADCGLELNPTAYSNHRVKRLSNIYQWPSNMVLSAIIAQCYSKDPRRIIPSVLKLKPYLYDFRFASEFEFAMALNELIGTLCRCPDDEREQYVQELAGKFGEDPDGCLAPGVQRLPEDDEREEAKVPEVVTHDQEPSDTYKFPDPTFQPEELEERSPMGDAPDDAPPEITAVEELLSADSLEEISSLPTVAVPAIVDAEYKKQDPANLMDASAQALAVLDFCENRNIGYSRNVIMQAYNNARRHNRDLPPLPPGRKKSDAFLRRRCSRASYKLRLKHVNARGIPPEELQFHGSVREDILNWVVHAGRVPPEPNMRAHTYLTTLYPPVKDGQEIAPSPQFKRFRRILLE